jgi:hypothetical protein
MNQRLLTTALLCCLDAQQIALSQLACALNRKEVSSKNLQHLNTASLVRTMSDGVTGRGVSHGENKTSHELAVGRQEEKISGKPTNHCGYVVG